MEDGNTYVTFAIRFASSLADLVLPSQPLQLLTAANIKQQIRSELPSETGSRRLRLIYAGKVLADHETLTSIIRPPSPALSDNDACAPTSPLSKGKSKALPPPRIWLHCSIGDILTPAELLLDSSPTPPSTTLTPHPGSATPSFNSATSSTSPSTTPAPQGFDRLLSASFSPAEVSALRAQFVALLAHTHTPDTMPSPREIRALEERWLNDGAMVAGGGNGSGGAGGSFGGDDGLDGLAGEVGSRLDDMLWGNLVGFFWPLGAGLWLIREESVWTTRRKMAIVSGVCINILFSMMRLAS